MNESNLTHNAPSGTQYGAKLHPNGEAVIYRKKKLRPSPMEPFQSEFDRERNAALVALYVQDKVLLQKVLAHMGLSNLRNSDKGSNEPDGAGLRLENKARRRNGQKGITAFGARRIRNGVYGLQSKYGPGGCGFITATLPALPLKDLKVLQEQWPEFVEHYRRKLSRHLRDKGICSDSVTVSEIQEKRYEKCGVPVLHLHSVFCCIGKNGEFAISREEHDEIWRSSISFYLPKAKVDVTSSCQIQRVKKSAESYLGKYMSKGSISCARVVNNGDAHLLPRQWWAMSKGLLAWIQKHTLDISGFADYLLSAADSDGDDVWGWHKNIYLEDWEGPVWVATYGRLTQKLRDWIFETRRDELTFVR